MQSPRVTETMKIAIIVVAIFCFASIEGGVQRAEFNFEALLKDVEKDENINICIRAAGANASKIKKLLQIGMNRFGERLAHIEKEDLTAVFSCFLDLKTEDVIIKWEQHYLEEACLEKIVGLNVTRTIYEIDRTIISFTKDVKEIVGGYRKKAIAVLDCLRYYSQGAPYSATIGQKTCIRNQGVDPYKIAKAIDEFQLNIRQYKITSPIQIEISKCSNNLQAANMKYTLDEEHYDLECLRKIVDFEDDGGDYNKDHAKYYMDIFKYANKDKAKAAAVLAC